MTEAEILSLSFQANEAVATLFSIFFGIVSAYIAALYFFLRSAPLAIKVISFALLTSGFLFLGTAMSGIELRLLGLIQAWGTLDQPVTGIKHLGNPVLPLPAHDLLDHFSISVATFDGNRFGIYSGWASAILVYLALAYLTFVYRWK